MYDLHDTPGVLINPEIVESDGEWTYSEGCLSVPACTSRSPPGRRARRGATSTATRSGSRSTSCGAG
ncbi:MAG: hypothetical protein R2699_15295 [Acidimicrobiales bacterium]